MIYPRVDIQRDGETRARARVSPCKIPRVCRSNGIGIRRNRRLEDTAKDEARRAGAAPNDEFQRGWISPERCVLKISRARSLSGRANEPRDRDLGRRENHRRYTAARFSAKGIRGDSHACQIQASETWRDKDTGIYPNFVQIIACVKRSVIGSILSRRHLDRPGRRFLGNYTGCFENRPEGDSTWKKRLRENQVWKFTNSRLNIWV